MIRAAAHILWIAALTALTQIGGLAWLAALGLRGWRRWTAFLAVYAGLSGAAMATTGRTALPCIGDPVLAPATPLTCLLNRHYAAPEAAEAIRAGAAAISEAYPGTVTQYLDAGFPFWDGFPTLPHLSHDDGRKIDLAFYYARDGAYIPGLSRSPLGYFAFEQPRPGDPQPCAGQDGGLTLRWNLAWAQPLFPRAELEPERTRALLAWLSGPGRAQGVGKILIEPHLARRLEVSAPAIRFQGCRAARHDDHLHVDIRD